MWKQFRSQDGNGVGEGLIYLVLAVIWLVAQVLSTVAQKRKRRQSTPESASSAATNRGGDKTPPHVGRRAKVEDALQGFLRELAGDKRPHSPLTPPSPSSRGAKPYAVTQSPRPIEALRPARGTRPVAIEVKDEAPGGSVAPIMRSAYSRGIILSSMRMRAASLPLARSRGMFPSAVSQKGLAAREALRDLKERTAARDAMVLKLLLGAPRALRPPGNDSYGAD